MIRQRHFIAVVASLIGCAVLLMVVGCSGGGSRAPKEKKQQGQTEATEQGQARSSGAASEEARCAQTQPIDRYGGGWVTNNVPGCPKGGPLSGTDSDDLLDGLDGDDEIRGLGSKDNLIGGLGSDVIYGGAGNDFLKGSTWEARDPFRSKDVLYGGPGIDKLDDNDGGDDVLYGGDGNDHLGAAWGEDVIYGGMATIRLWAKMGSGTSSIAVQAGTNTEQTRSTTWQQLREKKGPGAPAD